MSIQIMEGLEVEVSEDGIPRRRGAMVRLGPLNVPGELKDVIEAMANEEDRSISNMCVRLLERGLMHKATDAELRRRR